MFTGLGDLAFDSVKEKRSNQLEAFFLLYRRLLILDSHGNMEQVAAHIILEKMWFIVKRRRMGWHFL